MQKKLLIYIYHCWLKFNLAKSVWGKSQWETQGIIMNIAAPTSALTVLFSARIWSIVLREFIKSFSHVGWVSLNYCGVWIYHSWLCYGVHVTHSHKQLLLHWCIEDAFQLVTVNLSSYSLSHKTLCIFNKRCWRFKFRRSSNSEVSLSILIFFILILKYHCLKQHNYMKRPMQTPWISGTI